MLGWNLCFLNGHPWLYTYAYVHMYICVYVYTCVCMNICVFMHLHLALYLPGTLFWSHHSALFQVHLSGTRPLPFYPLFVLHMQSALVSSRRSSRVVYRFQGIAGEIVYLAERYEKNNVEGRKVKEEAQVRPKWEKKQESDNVRDVGVCEVLVRSGYWAISESWWENSNMIVFEIRAHTHAHACTRTHTHTQTHAHAHAHSHTHIHLHRNDVYCQTKKELWEAMYVARRGKKNMEKCHQGFQEGSVEHFCNFDVASAFEAQRLRNPKFFHVSWLGEEGCVRFYCHCVGVVNFSQITTFQLPRRGQPQVSLYSASVLGLPCVRSGC